MGSISKSNDYHSKGVTRSQWYTNDDIAVVGMSVNVAGAEDVEQFWNLILEAKSQHVEVPAHRFTFKSTAWRPVDPKRKWYGNFIHDYDAFDHKFFKKSPREALYADPQQRLFLQCAYQAVEQSGYFNLTDPDRRVGVYVGVGSAEYEANFACHQTNAFSATGNLKSAIAGRVSHYFGWTGPGLAVDTACSASAVAMHLACRAIASGDCTAALVGGTQMLTSPFHFQNLAGASFLSPTGPCKPFDGRADGYCRGEGIGAVFIKRMSDAVRDGDNILGCIASTAVLQNDSSTPMFVPNADSLASLFDTVISSAGLSPADITAVEAHGTGTKVGDPAEFESIRRVLGCSPGRNEPLPISSVKSLVGHTECASGLISLVKILLMLHHGIIPLQVGFKELNPELKCTKQDMIEVPRKHRAWQSDFRAALINSFGASGSNSAMVVTKVFSTALHDHKIEGSHPFWITGADTRSLVAYAAKLADFVETAEASLADIAYNLSKQSNRTLPNGVIFQVRERSELVARLKDFVRDQISPHIRLIQRPRPVILCFGGQTSNMIGLSRQLFQQSLILRKHLDCCEAIMNRLGFGSLYPAIFQTQPLNDTVQLQLALFALQYACAQAWIDCGIQVAAVVGHSFGELVCLAISGSLSLEDAIIVIHTRATLVREKFGSDPGAMMAVEGKIDDIVELIRASHHKASSTEAAAEIACYNGPTSFTLAGSSSAIDAVGSMLPQFKTLKGKKLSVSNAFHSSLVDTLVPELQRIGKGMAFRQPKILWERTQNENEDEDDTVTSDFFATHMRQPVHAHNAFERLHTRFPVAVWLEAGSNSTITRMAKRALGAPKASHFQAMNICNNETAVSDLIDVTEGLWREGIKVTYWLHHALHGQEYQHVLLPPYQFEKTRHWLELKDPESVIASSVSHESVGSAKATREICTFGGYLDSDRRSACYQLNTFIDVFEEALSGQNAANRHQSQCSITLAVAVATEVCRIFLPGQEWLDAEHQIKNVVSRTPLTLLEARKTWITIQPVGSSSPDAWRWVIYSTDNLDGDYIVHFEGEFCLTTGHELATYQRLVRYEAYHDLSTGDDPDDAVQGRSLYKVFENAVQYSSPYRGLRKLTRKAQQAAGLIQMSRSNYWINDPYLSDCVTQVSTYWLQCTDSRWKFELHTMTGFDKWIRLPIAESDNAEITREVYATHVNILNGVCLADMFVFDRNKQLVDVMIGVRFERLSDSPSDLVEVTLGNGRMAQRMSDRAGHNSTTSAASTNGVYTQAKNAPAPTQHVQYSDQTTALRQLQGSTGSEQILTKGVLTPSPSEQHRDDVTKADVVLQVLSSLSGVDFEDITQDTELADIGIDSLVEIELLSDLRKRCGADSVNMQGWKNVKTIADLVQCVGTL